MAVENLARSTRSHLVALGYQARRTFASYEGELPKIRLREVLAWEAVLRRQVDALIREQRTLRTLLSTLFTQREDAARCVASLTPREREIMELVLVFDPSKNIAADLGIIRRTVENHCASIMAKTGSACFPAVARLALASTSNGARTKEIQNDSHSLGGES